jgi:hypothetical protein
MTRRTALLSAGSALLLAACGGRPALMVAGNPKDVRILNAALASEREQIAFYELGVKLTGAPIVKQILEHQRAHAAAIEEAIRELGATPPPGRPGARYSAHHAAGAWRQDAILRQEQWSAGYQAVIPKLRNERLRSTFGALMTSEAEHAVALDVST